MLSQLTQSATVDLEALIDKHGLLHVLTGLELVCAEKAEHLRINWQDRASAKLWDRASIALGKVARSDAIEAVS